MTYVEILGQPYKGEVGKIIKKDVLYNRDGRKLIHPIIRVKILCAPYGLPEVFHYRAYELKEIPKHEAIARLI